MPWKRSPTELGLPHFRVPAPRTSAQHAAQHAATTAHHHPPDGGTRQFTPPPQHRRPAPPAGDRRPPTRLNTESAFDEQPGPTRQFAGIDLDEFAWARQRGRRAVVLWVLAVLVINGAGGWRRWTLGLNINGLLGR